MALYGKDEKATTADLNAPLTLIFDAYFSHLNQHDRVSKMIEVASYLQGARCNLGRREASLLWHYGQDFEPFGDAAKYKTPPILSDWRKLVTFIRQQIGGVQERLRETEDVKREPFPMTRLADEIRGLDDMTEDDKQRALAFLEGYRGSALERLKRRYAVVVARARKLSEEANDLLQRIESIKEQESKEG